LASLALPVSSACRLSPSTVASSFAPLAPEPPAAPAPPGPAFAAAAQLTNALRLADQGAPGTAAPAS